MTTTEYSTYIREQQQNTEALRWLRVCAVCDAVVDQRHVCPGPAPVERVCADCGDIYSGRHECLGPLLSTGKWDQWDYAYSD